MAEPSSVSNQASHGGGYGTSATPPYLPSIFTVYRSRRLTGMLPPLNESEVAKRAPRYGRNSTLPWRLGFAVVAAPCAASARS